MAWTDTDNVRLITGLSIDDISDTDLSDLIDTSQKEVLLKVNNKVIREEVEYIDDTRTNKIDGSNTNYYIKNWKGNFISDDNYDLAVNTNDINVISVDSDGVESIVAISSVTSSSGMFTTSVAQDNVDLFISYSYSYFDPITPNPMLKLASEYLAGAYSYMRINSSQNKQVKFGNVSITNGVGSDSSYMFLYNKYLDIMRQLNEQIGGGAIWGVSKVLI